MDLNRLTLTLPPRDPGRLADDIDLDEELRSDLVASRDAVALGIDFAAIADELSARIARRPCG
jgi:hypothetical protein